MTIDSQHSELDLYG